MPTPSTPAAIDDALSQMTAERDRLQTILDSRPAINAGLPETYINWSHSIYAMNFIRTTETKQ